MLQRRPGYVVPCSWDLDTYDRSRILDVNGYYALLGLVVSGVVQAQLTCHDIAKVARRRLYDYHPDRGEFDAEMWQQVSQARRCLIDPETRHIYDNLPAGARFVDETLISRIRGVQEVTDFEQPEPDVPCVYYTDALPSETEIAQWLTVVSYAMKHAGITDVVRVAISDHWCWAEFAWGRVLFVDRHHVDLEKIAWEVSKRVESEQFLAFCRIAKVLEHTPLVTQSKM